MSVYLSYRCMLCPNTYDDETDTRNATTFVTLEEACTHLVAYHHIDPELLQQVKAGSPISIRIGSLNQTAHPWKLPKYGEVIEVYHEDIPEQRSDDERSSTAAP